MQKESVDKLKLLLEMLDSQIVLDHRGTDSNTNMKEDTNILPPVEIMYFKNVLKTIGDSIVFEETTLRQQKTTGGG